MKKAWMVRPIPHSTNRISEFRQGGIIAIGWPGLGDLTGKTRDEIKKGLTEDPYNQTGKSLSTACTTVDYFINQMQSGDFVLVPNGDDIYFAEICSDYFYDAACAEDGYPNQRKVKWMENLMRKDLSISLRNSIRANQTIVSLNGHYEEISTRARGGDYKSEASETGTVIFSYPLRKDFTITLEIPADMTKNEAKRLAQNFETLYFDE